MSTVFLLKETIFAFVLYSTSFNISYEHNAQKS